MKITWDGVKGRKGWRERVRGLQNNMGRRKRKEKKREDRRKGEGMGEW